MFNPVEVALLARLIRQGSCVETKKSEAFLERYRTAKWILKSPRRHEWDLRESAMQFIRDRLTAVLPSWESDFEFLEQQGKSPYNPSDLEALPQLRRSAPRKTFINRRNWKAISSSGPKRQQRRECPDVLTSDWILRLKPNKGLVAILTGKEVDLSEIADQWTECVIPERAWKSISGFKGRLPDMIITCENLGAYIDLPVTPNIAVVFSPGKNVSAAVFFLSMLKQSRWMHFGDIDPDGLNIATDIAKKTARRLSLFIPFFIEEYLGSGYKPKSPWKALPCSSPLIEKYKKSGKGLYQESLLLDERLRDAISHACEHELRRGL